MLEARRTRMPIRDHFRAPIEYRLPWESLRSSWISEIAGRLNDLLPANFLALDRMRIDGGLEIDIGAAETGGAGHSPGVNGADGGGVAVAAAPAVYNPPAVAGTAPFVIADVAEIRVFAEGSERKLVGAVELVSPRNKHRPEAREAFVGKCLDYLSAGVSLVIVDVVTDRRAVLHNDIVRRLADPPPAELADDTKLYAAAYRPVIRNKKPEIDVRANPFAVGDPLPTMPLRLVADCFVPVELELTYTEACRRRRLV
jgi:hypothetical protein